MVTGLLFSPPPHHAAFRPSFPSSLVHARFVLVCPLRSVTVRQCHRGSTTKSAHPSQTPHLLLLPRSSESQSPPTTLQNDLDSLRKLALSPGALGRGVRATIFAFYRRGIFLLSGINVSLASAQKVYIEIGPAYVLATALLGSQTQKVTRFAVEQRAWPALQRLLKWSEVSAEAARHAGAPLRKLSKGGRYGRHVFLTQAALTNIITIAEELIAGDGIDTATVKQSTNHATTFNSVNVEAMIDLKRLPVPGVRTVAAKCPRREAHKHGDQNPSLVLWMNSDGLTGGALCPVCLEESYSQGVSNQVLAPRNMTWRVIYVRDNLAALCTPLRRVYAPPNVKRIASKWLTDHCHAHNAAYHENLEGFLMVDQQKTSSTYADENSGDNNGRTSNPVARKIKREGKRRRGPKTAADVPVGGCVLCDKRKTEQMGRTTSLAYVTASLKIARDATTTGLSGEFAVFGDETRLRTVGTKARLSCPMQILLWSERRSKGPTSSRRIEDVSWFAKQALSFGSGDEDGLDDGTDSVADGAIANMFSPHAASEEWVPTPVVSVSVMRPCGWRDVMGTHKRFISVPSGWEPVLQAWVLFDIDELNGLVNDSVVEDISSKITLAIRRNLELSGRCLVVQTGPNGLHVWAELREVREQARLWFKTEETRLWYADVGQKILAAAYRGGAFGGKIDMSSCCAGRFARRPGWRLLKDGTAFRSRVVTYVLGRVKSRKPRV